MVGIIQALKGAALVSVVSLCAAGTVLLCTVERDLQRLPIAATQAKINLDLDEAHRVLLESGLTAMEARKASAEELQALPAMTADVQASMVNLNALLASVRRTSDGLQSSQAAIATSAVQTLNQANSAIATLEPTERQATDTLAAIQQSARDLDTLTPQLQATATNIQGMTSSGNKILADGAYETHKLTHPEKKQLTFWGAMWLFAQGVHKLEPPIF